MKKFFISSTFVDMNAERDALQQIVFPEINDIAKKYGDVVDCCDLRWGVDTSELESEEGAKKVLDVCFSEIETCVPYMVIILGDRYGWIPNTKTVKESIENVPGFAVDSLSQSITAMEIEYGAVQKSEQNRVFIYFREIEGNPPACYKSEGQQHAKQLAQLKQKLQKLFPDRVRTYTLHWEDESCLPDMSEFSQMVRSDILNELELEWENQGGNTALDNAHKWQMQMMHKWARPYPGGLEWLESYPDGEFLKILGGGAATCRTSSLCSIGIAHLEKGWNVLPVFCTQTDCCLSVEDVQKYIIYHIEKLLNLKHERIPQKIAASKRNYLKERLSELVDVYSHKASAGLLIAIDDMELLLGANRETLIDLLPAGFSDKVRIIGTIWDKTIAPGAPDREDYEKTDPEEVIRFALKNIGKELSSDVIKAVVEKARNETPIYITMLIRRLCMMDIDDFSDINKKNKGIASISEQQIAIINSSRENFNLYADMLKTAAEQFNDKSLYTAVRYLAVTKKGLRERDLAAIFERAGLKWNSLNFKRYLLYVNEFFYVDANGRIFFLSRAFLQGVAREVSQNKRWENGSPTENEVLEYVRTLPIDDCVFTSEFLQLCRKTNSPDLFLDFVTKDEFSDKKMKSVVTEIIELTDSDNGAFLKLINSTATNTALEYKWLLFLGKVVWPRLVDELPGCIPFVGLSLAMENAHRTHALLEKSPTQENLLINILWCKIAGFIYAKHYSSAKAQEFYNEAAASAREFRQLSESDLDIIGEFYLELAGFYAESKKPVDETLQIYELSAEIYRELNEAFPEKYTKNLINIYYQTGDFCRQNKKKDVAEDYFSRAIEICEKTKGTSPNQQIDDWYFPVFDSMFLTCLPRKRNLFSTQSYEPLKEYEKAGIEKAKYYLDLFFEYIKKQYKANPSTYRTEAMCLTYSRYGDYYDVLGGEDNFKKAIEMYENAKELNIRLSRSHITEYCIEMQEYICGRLGSMMCRQPGNYADYDLGLEYFNEAYKWSKRLSENVNLTEKQSKRRKYYLEKLAELHYNRGDNENLGIAAKWYQELLLHNKRMGEGSKEYYSFYSTVRKLVDIYKCLGIDDHQEIAKRIFGNSPTEEELRSVQNCWNSPANPFGF